MIRRRELLNPTDNLEKRNTVIPRIALSIAALVFGAWANCALAASVPHSSIRQSLFTTCTGPDGKRWIVGELGRIFSTTDNAQTIFRVEIDSREPFLAIACSPDGSLLIAGQRGLLLRSRDNGANWQTLPSNTDRTLLAATYADANTVLAIGDFGTVIRSTDGGDSWTSITLPEDLSLPEDIAEIIDPGDVLLYGIDFPSPTLGWIVGEFGTVLKTDDGGESWVAQDTPVDTTLFGVSFADAQRGWAVGLEEVMLQTTDGGETWEVQQIAQRRSFDLGIYNVAVRGNIGWAVGDNGLLLRSTNAGKSWERVELPIVYAANWLRDIDLNDKGEGLIVGGEGMILTTRGDQYQHPGR